MAEEHVEVVPVVVALLEALGAERHAGGDAARAAPVGHKVGRPDQAAGCGIVVDPHCNESKKPEMKTSPSEQGAREGRRQGRTRLQTCVGELVGGAAPGHEPLAPVDGLELVDGLAGVEE